MSGDEGARVRMRWLVGAAVLGAAGATSAAWVAQHRRVRRSLEAAEEAAVAEGLVLPSSLGHHEIDTDDGARLHVVERGDGPALVLLHGIMLSSDIWVHQLNELADRHRVVAVDLRGHGRSTAGDRTITVETMADDVCRVLDALGLRQCLLVGHSMGGMVALQVAHDLAPERRRELLSGVAVVSSAAGPFFTVPGSARVAKVGLPAWSQVLLAAERLGVWAMPAEDLRWWLTRLSFGPEPNPAQVRFAEQLHHSVSASTLAQLLPGLATFDLSREVADIDVPVLVVVGSKDRLTPPRHARRLASALPRAELVELPRCGHTPMLERRREFSRLLEEFCAKVG
jgi:pimeloyl-ACP methyl ester carboxylesterase